VSDGAPETDPFVLGIRALARVGDLTPAPDHSVFWGAWYRRLVAERPILEPVHAPDADPSDPSATHRFRSLEGVRIGATLVEPPEGVPVRAGLVAVHGGVANKSLAQSAHRWRELNARGVSVLVIRIRGFPGSRLDTAHLPESCPAWIEHGLLEDDALLEGRMGWVLSSAVADVANACRVMRNRLAGIGAEDMEARPLRDKLPLFLHGESLGAALATIAAAQLTGRLRQERVVERIVLGTPTLGDWAWRLAHPPPPHSTGTGRAIHALLEANPDRAEAIRTRLHLMDTTVHASRIRVPTLCKLAMHDEVVPAPAAAAVYNALASSPGQKWRFLVPYGHVEGDLAGARRASLFERCAADFLDPQREVEEAMDAWEPLMLRGEVAPVSGASGEQERLFDTGPGTVASDEALIEAYQRAGRTLDALPYSEAFERLYAEVRETLGEGAPSRHDAFHRLHNLRKRGALPRLGRTPVSLPKISSEDEALLTEMVVQAVGSMGARDRLPYSPEFETLVERFNTQTGHTLRHEDAWRLIARLAK
jgi:cephalosporin-C deacetylase-like acetyl esterase